MKKILVIFGTRPEAVKMAPVIHELHKHDGAFRTRVCVSAQHRQLLDQVLSVFAVKADYDLDIMRPGQDLFDITNGVLQGLKKVLEQERPDLALVHGDTTTTLAASIAAYYCRVPVGHVEAGLRTEDRYAPFPEELNRRVTGVLADWHFAPTERARENLLREGVKDSAITVTGNTAIDALLAISGKIDADPGLQERLGKQLPVFDPSRKLLLVTGHRRENFGDGFENICRALKQIAVSRPEVDIVYPVHLNPNVKGPVTRALGRGTCGNIHLIEPVDYVSFVYLMRRAHLILTDSGGVQEEAPSLRKPVLVMRDVTERPEAIEAGTARLVGTDCEAIVRSVLELLENDTLYKSMSQAGNPYGDGQSAKRIVDVVMTKLAH